MHDTTRKKHEQQYRKLAPLQQALLRIIAVSGNGASTRTSLLRCVSALSLRNDSGKTWKPTEVRKALTDLQEGGLVTTRSSRLSLPGHLRMIALLDSLEQPDFADQARTINDHLNPPHLDLGRLGNAREDLLLRNLQISILTGAPEKDIRHLLQFAIVSQVFGFRAEHPLKTLFLDPYYPEILPHLVASGSPVVVNWVLERVATEILPLQETGDLARLLASDTCRPEQQARIITSLLFCGRNDLVEELLEDPAMAACELPPLQALLAVFTGRTNDALAGFDRWAQVLRKASRKKFVPFPGYAQFLFLCTLLRSADPQRLNQGMQTIRAHGRRLEDTNLRPATFLALAMQEPFAERLGLTLRPAERLVDLELDEVEISLPDLLHCMILSWIRPGAARKQAPRISRILARATSSQNLWLVAEAANILARLGMARKKHTDIVGEIRRASGLACLSDCWTDLPAWQKTLLALQGLADGAAGSATTGGQRLVWFLGPHSDPARVTLEPRLQKKGKNGRWSKGRVVALKTLFEKSDSMEGLSDLDRSLVALITIHREQQYWYGHRKTTYQLDPVKALPLLARHPLVFLADSPSTRMDIVMARPGLSISHEKDRVRLELVPPAKAMHEEGALVRETPTRYTFYRLDSGQQRLYQILARPMTLPAEAADSLRSSVASLSSLATIQSDLDGLGDDIPTEQGDPTPHVHLLPAGQGLQAEFLVRPLAGADTWCRPGRGGETVLARVEGRPVKAVRDLDREQQLCEQVIRSCPTLERQEPVDGIYRLEDPQDSLEMLLELGRLDEQVVLEWPRGEKFRVRGEASFARLSLRLKKDRDWFAATGRLEVDNELALDLKQLLQMLEQSPGRFVQLDDGSFLALTREFRKRISELRAYGELRGKGVRIPPLASLALEELTEQAGSLHTDRAWKEHVARLARPVDPELPSTLQARLRPYQVEGFRWLARLSQWGVGACLADDMGLGKTVQALAAVLLRAPDGPTLVVAPLSVIANWQEEARRFAPTLQVRHFGPGDRDACLDDLGPFALVVCSYGLLATEIDRLAKVDWQTVILDEAQAIKNHQTRRARAALRLKAGFRLATTGTPLENNLSELWSLFRFLNPGLLGSRKSFHERFVLPIEGDRDREARHRLRRLIRPFLLRRIKSEVLQELPPRTDIALEVVMSPEEAALYEAQRQTAVERLAGADNEEDGGRHLRILAEIMRLRRLCCNPRLLDPDSRIPSSKLKVFDDILAELLAGGHKALVFSQFVDHLHIIRDHLDEQKISYQYLDGQTSRKQRETRVRAFQAGKGDVFLISLKAGGTGLNLTAADYVIHMDPWWNPAVEDQASDRAHRIGQQRPVTVYRLVTRGTIEEQIVRLHEEKRDLADSLLSGTDISARLTTDELLHLLRQERENDQGPPAGAAAGRTCRHPAGNERRN